MRNRVWIALALASALGLAGCGGGGGNPSAPTLSTVASVNAASTAPTSPPIGGFKQMVVFGDSLSDDGAYTLAPLTYWDPAFGGKLTPSADLLSTGLPYPRGGQFTVNGLTDANGKPFGNWTNQVATDLGINLTPNIIGYFSPNPAPGGYNYLISSAPYVTNAQSSAFCAFSAPPSSGAATCTNFAQGGSMVSTSAGIGNPQSPIQPGGAMTYPVTVQVQNYLDQFGGKFSSNQLVTLLAGNNDILSALGVASASIKAGTAQSVAVANAQATVAQAADDLTVQIKKILNNGGQYVLVYTLPDLSLTPYGQSLSGGATCDNTDIHTPCYLASNLVQVFNQRLLNDIQGQPVKVMDGFGLLNSEIANPAKFGLANVKAPVCDITGTLKSFGGSSLFCNQYTLAPGLDPSNSLFADALHPTPYGYQIIANSTLQAMKGFGWISQ